MPETRWWRKFLSRGMSGSGSSWKRGGKSAFLGNVTRNLRTRSVANQRHVGVGERVAREDVETEGREYSEQHRFERLLRPSRCLLSRVQGYETAPPWDPTVRLCLGHSGGPRGSCVFLFARYPSVLKMILISRFCPNIEATFEAQRHSFYQNVDNPEKQYLSSTLPSTRNP